MITETQNEQTYRLNQIFFQKKAKKNYQETIYKLKKIIKSFFVFNLVFFSILVLQIVSCITLVFFMKTSLIIAFLLAGIFLTLSTYLMLIFYFQSKKITQIIALKNDFIKICKKALSIPINSAEYNLTIAYAAVKLGESALEDKILKLPKFLQNFKKIYSFLLKEDIFKFKEFLFLSAIERHLDQLKTTPTDLELHTSLASIFTNLSFLYINAKKNIFFSKNKKSSLKKKSESCILSAIEEYKILNDYAPNDPWIHLQLAQNYKKLNLINEQIKEYEAVYKLCPNDSKVLFQLAILYFETKRNSKGLRIYEELNMRSFKDAEKLLSYYGAFKTQEILEEYV